MRLVMKTSLKRIKRNKEEKMKKQLLNKKGLEQGTIIIGVVIGGLVLLKFVGVIADHVAEYKQNKEIRNLKKRVSELEERVDQLENK